MSILLETIKGYLANGGSIVYRRRDGKEVHIGSWLEYWLREEEAQSEKSELFTKDSILCLLKNLKYFAPDTTPEKMIEILTEFLTKRGKK